MKRNICVRLFFGFYVKVVTKQLTTGYYFLSTNSHNITKLDVFPKNCVGHFKAQMTIQLSPSAEQNRVNLKKYFLTNVVKLTCNSPSRPKQTLKAFFFFLT